LRSGIWVASSRRICAVSSGPEAQELALWLDQPDLQSAPLDVSNWRLGAFEDDPLGPSESAAEPPVTLSGADLVTLAARASELGVGPLTHVAHADALFGLGANVVAVLDPATLEPIASFWLHDVSLVVVAEDGTFLMDAAALDDATVTVGDVWVPARILAPWLLDPLHLRALAHDDQRAARRFPVR
jgi:hypothetical protein